MSDRTAFPWCPVTRWQRDDRGRVTIWHVRIDDPAPRPEWMSSVSGQGATPTEALTSLLQVVAWWLDYDGRRGGTVAEKYRTIDPNWAADLRSGLSTRRIDTLDTEPPF